MKPGELRFFNGWVVHRDSVSIAGKPIILLGQVLEEPSFYERWYVLVDGKYEIIDEHTLIRFTDEAR